MENLAGKIREGDVRALARAATAVENRRPEAKKLLAELAPFTGHACTIGITGPPGAGKSTLVDRMIRILREEERTVGIISVDPTSPFSGGAILGDRIRMQEHHSDPGVFIRSMATRGSLGGLAAATADLVRLLDASGKDVVLLETVGVGQDGVEVARIADITILVLVPGMGDDIQAIKAGIMEIADLFVINKADHPGVERIEQEIRAAVALSSKPGDWSPPILKTVASEGDGVRELMAAIRDARKACPGKNRRFARPEDATHYQIDHLGVAVRSLETALSFWEGQLGMRVAGREHVPAEAVNVAMLPVGGTRLELLEPTGHDSAIGRFLNRRGQGLHHVALVVPDLRGTVDRLRAAGARILNEPRPGAGGHLYVFVHPASTGGILLELIQEGEQI